MPALLLVRHCESSGPEPDAPLTSRGRAQAARLARFLAEYSIDALVASPFLTNPDVYLLERRSRREPPLRARLARRMRPGR